MNCLFTGNLSQISDVFLSNLDPDHKYVTYHTGAGDVSFHADHAVNFHWEEKSAEKLQKICGTYDFDTVVYFSESLDGGQKVSEELDKLEYTLRVCHACRVLHFIYIMNNDVNTEDFGWDNSFSREIMLNACEDMCRKIHEITTMNILLLRVPYLYNNSRPGNQLRTWIGAGNQGEEIVFPGTKYTETDFLCDEDLARLLERLLDEPVKEGYHDICLSGDNRITFGELEELLTDALPRARVVYQNRMGGIPRYKKDASPREDYGWYPTCRLEQDLPELVKRDRQEQDRNKKKTRRRTWLESTRNRLRVGLEIVTLFFLAEFLNSITRDNVMMNFIDFRLVFVTIIGTMNGMNPGIIAGTLACLGYIVFDAAKLPWQVVFYNVQNWLPFSCYLLLATISGYIRDKRSEQIGYAKDQYKLLESKYVFLNDLYNIVLDSKDKFNRQIIGYKDSFGKIYSVVRRLNTMLPDEVFYEAVNTLEGLLENYSVAIYSVSGTSDYARLNVCSKPVSSTLSKSMKMSDYPQMMERLRAGDSFVNTACLKGYPMYAAPICKNETLMGIVLLLTASERQLNVEFENKFNIISDLIGDALIRAMEYGNLSDTYVDDTQILRAEKFAEILNIKQQMQEKEYMNYILVRLPKQALTMQEISDRVSRCIRDSDVMGMGEDGNIYLLLNQSSRRDLPFIRERIEKKGVMLDVLKD